jgi:VanZ family protein
MQLRVKWLGYAPAVLWTAFVLWLGSRTWDGVVQDWDWQPNDKLLHLWMYGTLGFLLSLGWRRAGRRPHANLVVLAGVLVGLYDELHQRTVPGRSADYRDFIVDVLAVTLGFILITLIQRLGRTWRPGRS